MAAHNQYPAEPGLTRVIGNASATVKRNASLEANIADIHTETKSLDDLIIAFPSTGGTASQALDVHKAAVSLDIAIKNTIESFASVDGPFSETTGNMLIDSGKVIVPDILQALANFMAKRAPLESAPLNGVCDMVTKDLQALKQDINDLAAVALSKMPAGVFSMAQAMAVSLDVTLKQAIAAFS